MSKTALDYEEVMVSEDVFPSCMMPDGAAPCEGYRQQYIKLKALQSDIERLRDAIEPVGLWLKSAIECENWRWDPDQHAAAKESLSDLEALTKGRES